VFYVEVPSHHFLDATKHLLESVRDWCISRTEFHSITATRNSAIIDSTKCMYACMYVYVCVCACMRARRCVDEYLDACECGLCRGSYSREIDFISHFRNSLSFSSLLSVRYLSTTVRSCGICGGLGDTTVGVLGVLQFHLPIFIPPNTPCSLIIYLLCYKIPRLVTLLNNRFKQLSVNWLHCNTIDYYLLSSRYQNFRIGLFIIQSVVPQTFHVFVRDTVK
jgi:hypothetical protein